MPRKQGTEIPKDARLLTAKEAAVYLGVSHRTVWAWAQNGWLPATRLGRRVLFDRVQLNAFIERATEDASS
jgi:excisionase family DNA binding protein